MAGLIETLMADLGPAAVLTGAAAPDRSADVWSSGSSTQPGICIRPADTAQVARVLALCHAASQSVIVHGGRTGLVQGTRTRPGDLVLSLERLRTIEHVDEIGHTLTAQAGVTLQAAQEAAESHGLLLPLDMGSRGTATLGGAAATNAGGNRVLRYGMMRGLVLGIEGVLPDGTVISSLNRMMKNNAGFDLKQLFIGTEGTLGVITRLVLRLLARPRSRQTALVGIPDFASMLRLLNTMDEELGGTLSAYEAMWQDFYRFVTGISSGRSVPLTRDHAYYVLLEAEGSDMRRDEERFLGALAAAESSCLVDEVVIAKSDRERNALWAIRDDVVRFNELRPMFIFDVSTPLTEMESYARGVRQAVMGAWPDAQFFTFGHLADGNLHFSISAGSAGGEDKAEVERLVYEPLTAIHGSVSAEHGIGLEKKPYLSVCRSPAEIELMRLLKRTLDPKGILNPGRVIDIA
jgi:FAD/FMN-containing dehydrogenase